MGIIGVLIFIIQVWLFLYLLKKAVDSGNETKTELFYWFFVGLVVMSMFILLNVKWN